MEKKNEFENRFIQRTKEQLNWIEQRLIELNQEKESLVFILEKFGIS